MAELDLEFVFLMVGIIAGIIVLAFIIMSMFRIIPQSYVFVIERLGAYHRTIGTGPHFLVPILDEVSNRINLREQVYDVPPQSVITRDNVTIQIDTVIYYQITDPKLYTYGIVKPLTAIEKMTATTLRNIIGDLELDETLTSRETINNRIRMNLDEVTDSWGIKVIRVEVQNIVPPREIMDAMEKQMRAERERRELILKAEGEKQSAILIAEGEKTSTLLRAEAQMESTIAIAEGEAQALERVYQAQAAGIKLINDAKPQESFLKLKSLEAMEKVADGQATKLIIPSNLSDFSSLLAVAKEVLANQPTANVKKNEKKDD